MKKCCMILTLSLLLTGCASSEDAFEMVLDVYVQSAAATQRKILLEVPNEAAQSVMTGDNADKLYVCDEYTIAVQTMDAGDLNGTVQTISGYGRDALTVFETQTGEFTRYDFVWVSAGEEGDLVGRAVVLDDGNYHYAVSCMAPEEKSAEVAQTWERIVSSFWLG